MTNDYLVSTTANSDHKWIRGKNPVSYSIKVHDHTFFHFLCQSVDLILVFLFIVSYADFFITTQQSYFFAYNGLRFWSTT